MSAQGAALPARDLLAALAVVVLWGLNFIAMRWGLEYFTPFQLGAARYVFAALPLVFLVRMPRLHWRWVLVFGLFQGVGQFGFLFFALKLGMTTALASVLMQTQVFFTALLGFGMLRERPSRARRRAGPRLCRGGQRSALAGRAGPAVLWHERQGRAVG